MEALIEYAVIGLVALIFFYLLTPTLLDFYGDASQAVGNTSGLSSSEADAVTGVLLLMLILFFLFGVWILYGSVQNRIEAM